MPAKQAVSKAGAPFPPLQVNRAYKWFWNYHFEAGGRHSVALIYLHCDSRQDSSPFTAPIPDSRHHIYAAWHFFLYSLVTNYLKSSSNNCVFLSCWARVTLCWVIYMHSLTLKRSFGSPPSAVIAQSVNLLCRTPLGHKHRLDVWRGRRLVSSRKFCIFVYSKSRWRCLFKDQPCFVSPHFGHIFNTRQTT